MTGDSCRIEIDCGLLKGTAPFIVALDDALTVIFASPAVRARIRDAAGMEAREVIAFADRREEVTAETIRAHAGEHLRMVLLDGDPPTPLAGQWFESGGGRFLLLAIPDVTRRESLELGLFTFEDFPRDGALVDLLITRNDFTDTLMRAERAVRSLEGRNDEGELLRKRLMRANSRQERFADPRFGGERPSLPGGGGRQKQEEGDVGKGGEEPWPRLLSFPGAGIFVLDAAGKVQRINESFSEITGYGEEEIAAGGIEILQAEACGEEYGFEGGKDAAFGGLYRIRAKDGRVLTVIRSSETFYDASGNRTGEIKSIVDVTPFTACLEAARRSAGKAETAAAEKIRAEAERTAAEARRKTEQAGAEAEKARSEAESARAEAEKARSEAESARAEVEKARLEAQQATEACRKMELVRAESLQTGEEALRDKESALLEAEKARARAEEVCAKAEEDAEKARLETEKARLEAESARSEAESARAEAEKARAEVEKTRAEAEKARAEAEKANSQVEAIRLRAEEDAEKARLETEKARARAEEVRAKAEEEAEKFRAEVEKVKIEAERAVEKARLEAKRARSDAEAERAAAEAARREAVKEAVKEAKKEAKKAKEPAADKLAACAYLAARDREIRDPMEEIDQVAKIALHSDLRPEQREFIEAIRRSAGTLRGTLCTLLDFSLMATGKPVGLAETSFDLRGGLEGSIDVFDRKARSKKLDVECSLEDDVPGRVVGDPQRLFRVLDILAENAIRSTKKGGVALRAFVDDRKATDLGLHFTVTDNGPGIYPEEEAALSKFVFSPAASRAGRDVLGLAVASRLAGLMGGRIWVESGTKGGNVFHFTARLKADGGAAEAGSSRGKAGLPKKGEPKKVEPALKMPLAPEPAGGEGKESPEKETPLRAEDSGDSASSKLTAIPKTTAKVKGAREETPPPAKEIPVDQEDLDDLDDLEDQDEDPLLNLNVLVVDDNRKNRKDLRTMLRSWDMKPTVVNGGRAALAALWRAYETGSPYSLILLDAEMPEMDGFSVAETIQRNSEIAGAKLILLTSDDQLVDARRCRDLGIRGCLWMPVKPKALLDKIRKVMSDEEGEEEDDEAFASQTDGASRKKD